MMDRAVVIVSALLLNAALGGPRRVYRAGGLTRVGLLPAHCIRTLARKLNREQRSRAQRPWRGGILAVGMLMLSLLLGWLLHALFNANGQFGELLLLAVLLPLRPAWDCAAQVRRGLKANRPLQAREALADTVWRHHALLDDYGVARAGIELLAVQFSEKIAAPALWYMLLGLPGLMASKTLYLLQENLTTPGQMPDDLVYCTQLLHSIFHYLPSRVCALLWIIVSAFLASPKKAQAIRQIGAGFFTASPQALSLICAGSVLKLSLGGPASPCSRRWLGLGTPNPTANDVGRALYLYALLNLLLFIGIGALI